MDYPFMRIPLDALRDGPWSWQGEFSADPAVWSAPGLDLTGNPRLTIRAEESADGSVHVTGELEVPFRLSCVRCLRELTVPTMLPIEAWFRSDADQSSEDGVYPLDERGAELSVREPIREELVLGRPGRLPGVVLGVWSQQERRTVRVFVGGDRSPLGTAPELVRRRMTEDGRSSRP